MTPPQGTHVAPTATCDLRVGGMDCASCAATVERALRSLEGVDDVRVDVIGGKVRVGYAEGKLARGDLTDAIRRVGYTVDDANDHTSGRGLARRAAFRVDGMDCADEVRLIDGNKDHCQAVEFAMTCLEKVVFEVDEAEMRRIAEASGGDRPDAWELKFKATYGQDHRAAVPTAEIKGLLRAVDSYRVARNLHAPHSELAFNNADAAQ